MESPVTLPAELNLCVPHPESSFCTQLARGSAIVALSETRGRIRIYYEGNVIGAENLARYRDRPPGLRPGFFTTFLSATPRSPERTSIAAR